MSDSDGKCGGLGPRLWAGPDDNLATAYTDFGRPVTILAPGTSIFSTYKNDAYAVLSRTSLGAPHVAGAAALYKAANPGASPSDVRTALLRLGSTPSTTCDGHGHGYITGNPNQPGEPLLYIGNLR